MTSPEALSPGHPANLDSPNNTGFLSIRWKGSAEREGQRERNWSPGGLALWRGSGPA
jgi:hypothetical protein